MEKLVVTGPTQLKGEVEISGAKNAAVAILPATLLLKGIYTINNLPNISDIKITCDILQDLGILTMYISSTQAGSRVLSRYCSGDHLLQLCYSVLGLYLFLQVWICCQLSQLL